MCFRFGRLRLRQGLSRFRFILVLLGLFGWHLKEKKKTSERRVFKELLQIMHIDIIHSQALENILISSIWNAYLTTHTCFIKALLSTLYKWKLVRFQAMPQQIVHLSYSFYFPLGPASTNNCLFSTKILQGQTSRLRAREREIGREGDGENLGSKGFEDPASRVAFVYQRSCTARNAACQTTSEVRAPVWRQ